MRNPCRRIASRCAPRAMNATSLPAFASFAPKYPPTPPVPITAIRITTPLPAWRSVRPRFCRATAKGRPEPARQACRRKVSSETRSRRAKLCAVSSIPITVRLVRPRGVDADVPGLLVRQWRQRRAELRQLQPRDLLVEMLRQYVDADRV